MRSALFRSLLAAAFGAFAVVQAARAAEMQFDLTRFPLNQTPTGFVSVVTGSGKAGDWKTIEEEGSGEQDGSKNNPVTRRRVLAQLSSDSTDEHFPLLIYRDGLFGDFKVTTRFKIVSGVREQMAGIAFRIQDEKNYYVLRASAAGKSFRFYKFVNGERSAPIGPEVEIPTGVWHEMSVECEGNKIRCWLNGREAISGLTDNSFTYGKIGFWTKSDSVAYFAGMKINYVPRERLAQKLVRTAMHDYPRLLGAKIAAPVGDRIKILASSDEKEVGADAPETEGTVLRTGQIHHGKSGKLVAVVLPLRDRNGDVAGALRVLLKPFAAQSEQSLAVRAMPIAKALEAEIQSKKDLLE